MASDTKNVKLGVCRVYYNGVDLGYTKGGVEVNVSTETHPVTVDQFGSTAINELIMGRELKVTVPLAETTLENLVAIMPGATLTTNGANKSVGVTTGMGFNLLDLARPLRLHPVGKADEDISEDFIVGLAGTAGNLSYAYKVDEERIFNTEFTGYPDPVTGKLFAIGEAAPDPINGP